MKHAGGSSEAVDLLLQPPRRRSAFRQFPDCSCCRDQATGVSAQPDDNQAHRGTVIHRRWSGDKAAALGEDAAFEIKVQRQPDDNDDLINYAVVTTVAMPGISEVYTQVRDRVVVKPKAAVPVNA